MTSRRQKTRGKPLSIAVIGAGAIGSVVAGYLTKAGVNVTLIGKLEQVREITANGLKMQGVRGIDTVSVPIEPKLNKEYDLVIFTVKTQDLKTAITSNKQFLKKSLILSSQNGVQGDAQLKKHLPKDNIYSSIVMFGNNCLTVTFHFIFNRDLTLRCSRKPCRCRKGAYSLTPFNIEIA